MDPKQRAAEAALPYLKSHSTIGLGTGSTAEFFIRALAQRLRAGEISDLRGVPTSVRSEELARELGIPIANFLQQIQIDVTVDGADEVTDSLDLIKGLGGALLREKIVAQNSRELIIIVDKSKHVGKLGTRSALPVEVAVFAHEAQQAFLNGLGAQPLLRMKDGKPFVTDNGNYIYDCRFPNGIADPRKLDEALAHRAGIVESGLFLGIASMALVADESGVRTVRNAG